MASLRRGPQGPPGPTGPQGAPGAGAPPAGTGALGSVKLSHAPADQAHPVAVEDADPRNTNARAPTDGSVTSAKLDATFLSSLAKYASAGTWTAQQNYQVDRSAGLTAIDSNALIRVQQTRSGTVQGDPALAVIDASMSAPYGVQTYITDNGALWTGRFIVVSQKRLNAIGGVAANGALIQGISSTVDGAEPSMIGASTDVDGPAVQGETYTANAVGKKNNSAFAAYDLDDVTGGVTSYSPGYGKKKFVIRGDGGLWWSSNFAPSGVRDNFAAADVRVLRGAAGRLELDANALAADTIFRVNTASGRAATLDLGGNATLGAVQISSPAGAPTNPYILLNNGATAVIRMYNNVRGVTNSPGIAVGGVDDNTAVGLFQPVSAALAATRTLVARAKSGTQQTGSLFEAQDSGSSALVSIPALGGLVVGKAALATTATDGFLYLPTCAGAPTGVPTTQAGTVAAVYDTTNNKLMVYNGAWKGVTLA